MGDIYNLLKLRLKKPSKNQEKQAKKGTKLTKFVAYTAGQSALRPKKLENTRILGCQFHGTGLAIKDMDYMRIIAMPWLKCLSELFEGMKKTIVKSKDLTP